MEVLKMTKEEILGELNKINKISIHNDLAMKIADLKEDEDLLILINKMLIQLMNDIAVNEIIE
jgi:hypothetical protein